MTVFSQRVKRKRTKQLKDSVLEFFFSYLLQVCFLGAVGLTCWIIKAPISGYWAAIGNGRIESDVSRYFAWAAAKYFARGISTAFLMGLFLKVKVQSLARKNSEMIANHFLVPAMILTIFGAFAESLIDQYVGPVDSRLRFVTSYLFPHA